MPHIKVMFYFLEILLHPSCYLRMPVGDKCTKDKVFGLYPSKTSFETLQLHSVTILDLILLLM